jgi:hypothetical protein
MAFDYGPFAPGNRVIVFRGSEWYVGVVQSQNGDSVFIKDENGLLDYYDEVSASQCFPAYHSDINLIVKKYEQVSQKKDELDKQILQYLREKF